MYMNKNNYTFFWRKVEQGFVLLITLMVFATCKKSDSIYEEYIVPNGLAYPGIAEDAEAHPGKNRIEIAWKNSADPKVVKARIFWNNYTDSTEVTIASGVKNVAKEIKPMAEDTYSFMIHTYDAKGNMSVPVEVMGTVYGALYQRMLVNRFLKSAVYDMGVNKLNLEWQIAAATEAGMNVFYTDVQNKPRTVSVDRSETAFSITDLQVGKPVFYSTLYKPDSLAIDLFETPQTLIPYVADVTAQVGLKNTKPPFSYGANTIDASYVLNDWTVTPSSLSANGNYDAGTIAMYTGYGRSNGVTDGKFYQTVELEAGNYTFNAYMRRNDSDGNILYLVANDGNGLPNTSNVEQEALKYVRIPSIAENSNQLVSINFTLSEKKTVSLGLTLELPTGSLRIVRVLQVELLKQF